MPPPEHIRKNLSVLDDMRREGILESPKLIARGATNMKNASSRDSQFIYGNTMPHDMKSEASRVGAVQVPHALAQRKVGRFVNSPVHMKSSMDVLKDQGNDNLLQNYK